MKSKNFAALATAAGLSLIAAVAVYSARAPWTVSTTGTEKLMPGLQTDAGKVVRVVVTQGGKTTTIEKSSDQWQVRNQDGYPASADKVRTLLTALADAKLLEPKTRMTERYATLEVDDPSGKNSNARLIKLEDADGATVAAVIAGKPRLHGGTAGAGAAGTYVRMPGEEQSWLASTTISGGAALKDWVNPRVFETQTEKIGEVTVEVQGEPPYALKRGADGTHQLDPIPAGKKVKYVNMVDNIIEAASFLDFDGVRKQTASEEGKAGSVTFKTDDGLTITLKVRREKDGTWATIDATGEGNAKKTAEDISARAKGWEFEIMPSKADTMLKKQADLLEDAAS
ncbi:DUF4340 domain-containing protein [Hyphomicrobium sp.]|uniref:DUF4340 domain-containing protein n=1 Tax=Hyphomicrobium sp. TaxID=82 RepID=UPI002E368327|nr:DUF4340 domain-containing protein [Hyphomicrobium sp.]HEX2842587.1 DUF4340 domain-containing protein [Hyphomicrobium sp.]